MHAERRGVLVGLRGSNSAAEVAPGDCNDAAILTLDELSCLRRSQARLKDMNTAVTMLKPLGTRRPLSRARRLRENLRRRVA